MHRRLRIAFSKRMELMQTDIDVCDACIRHIIVCKECRGDRPCELGDALFFGFKRAQARAALLMNDDGGYSVER
jgi:hypothetical protein